MSEELKEKYRKSPSFFTRKRIFTFATVLIMKINIISKSLSVEIEKFLGKFHFSGLEVDASKQGFSQASSRIDWEVYRHLNDSFVMDYYSDDELKKYKGKYLVLAHDGTTYELPYEKKLITEFHTFDNGQGQPKCLAQGGKLYDVLNNINLVCHLLPYHDGSGKGQSERDLFDKSIEHLPKVLDNQQHNVILLGDKYYPSFYYLYELPRLGYDFIFRCTNNFCKEVSAFVASGALDDWIEIDFNYGKSKYSSTAKRISNIPTAIKVRCVLIPLANGDFTYVLTNIDQNELSEEDVKSLYRLRWGEETSFDTDKNKVEVENFASKTPNGVKQDFHAKMLSINITQLLVNDAQARLEEEQALKSNKHDYQINHANALGIVKDELPKLLTGQELVEEWYRRLLRKIYRRREAVRPNRSNPRKKKHKLKYPMNRRRVV